MRRRALLLVSSRICSFGACCEQPAYEWGTHIVGKPSTSAKTSFGKEPPRFGITEMLMAHGVDRRRRWILRDSLMGVALASCAVCDHNSLASVPAAAAVDEDAQQEKHHRCRRDDDGDEDADSQACVKVRV